MRPTQTVVVFAVIVICFEFECECAAGNDGAAAALGPVGAAAGRAARTGILLCDG